MTFGRFANATAGFARTSLYLRYPPRLFTFALVATLALALPAFAQSQGQGGNTGEQGQPTLDELLELGEGETGDESGSTSDDASRSSDAAETSGPSGTSEPSDPSARPSQDRSPATQRADRRGQLTEDLREQLQQQQKEDPFASAVSQMETVAQRLGRDLNPDRNTRRMQQQILRKLDQVLAKARKQRSGGGGGRKQNQQSRRKNQGGQNPAGQQGSQQQGRQSAGRSARTGGQRPSGRSGEGGSTAASEAESMEALRRQWGNLPPRLRNELSEGLDEPFSPVYQSLTEEYYRGLAEQMQSGQPQ